MADLPWTKIYHDDLLQGARAANLSAEEFGVYCTALLLIASRGAPIEDDPRWIGQMAGCSTRKANQILDRLEQIPNKLIRRNGMIGNQKMLNIIKAQDRKSNQARQAAHARWHGDDQTLPLNLPDEKAGKKPGKSADKNEIKTPKKQAKSQKTAKSDYADASPPVRARDSEAQNIPTTPHPIVTAVRESGAENAIICGSGSVGDNSNPGGPDARADPDLWAWYEAIGQASGHNPVQPGQIARAMGFVEQWRDAGYDLDQVILSTIREMVAKTDDPTRTLGRFDAAIKHQSAKRAAQPRGRSYRAPEAPVLEPDGEDEAFRPMRLDLLDRLGPDAFSALCNHVRFEAVDMTGMPSRDEEQRRPIKINDTQPGSGRARRLTDGEMYQAFMTIARKHGFNEIW